MDELVKFRRIIKSYESGSRSSRNYVTVEPIQS